MPPCDLFVSSVMLYIIYPVSILVLVDAALRPGIFPGVVQRAGQFQSLF